MSNEKERPDENTAPTSIQLGGTVRTALYGYGKVVKIVHSDYGFDWYDVELFNPTGLDPKRMAFIQSSLKPVSCVYGTDRFIEKEMYNRAMEGCVPQTEEEMEDVTEYDLGFRTGYESGVLEAANILFRMMWGMETK